MSALSAPCVGHVCAALGDLPSTIIAVYVSAAQLRNRSYSGGGVMKIVGVFTSMIFGLAAAVYATAALADDIIATKAVPAATTKASLQPATCSSLEDFVVTACPLTWNGITVYGTIDMGVTWLSHGAPFNGTSAPGLDYIIQKYS